MSAPWRAPRLWVRLALGFGALIALMLIVVVLAVLQFRKLGLHADQMLSHDLRRLLQVQEIRRHTDSHGNALVRLLTAPRADRESIYPILDAQNAQLVRLISELSSSAMDARSTDLLSQIAQHQTRYRDVFSEVAVWIESDDVARASSLFHDAGQPALRGLLDATALLFDHEQSVLAQRQRETGRSIVEAQWWLALLTLGAMTLAVWLAWRTTSSVSRPLGQIETAARRIAQGEYGARIQACGEDELGRVAQAMNGMAAAVAARELEIEHLAYYDRLSDLPNRNGMRHIAANLGPLPMGMIMMDVARLRTVNEVLGFETGDMLLTQVSERLREAIAGDGPPGSTRILGRLAGGVFAVLCVDMDRSDMERLMERIDHRVSAPMECDGQIVDAQLVYGLVDSAAGQERAFNTLLQQAELAVGDAKQGRRAWAWHVPLDTQARAGQLSLLSSLRSAAVSGELQMWLQPKQCLRTGRIRGMEALVRWRHPQRGLISPAEFLPFAERTGHIGVVTRAMLDAAMRTLSDWRTAHPALRISVNVSALDIRDTTFANRVAQMARLHRAPLENLCLELTETSLMEDPERAMPTLLALRQLGVKLSIDDFGTGYSSLAYLGKLPVDELKIDRGFVANADLRQDATALLRTIIDLGHSLNMQVTAEGVERPEELELLTQLGCDQAQGYLISRPMDPMAVDRFVAVLPIDESGNGS